MIGFGIFIYLSIGIFVYWINRVDMPVQGYSIMTAIGAGVFWPMWYCYRMFAKKEDASLDGWTCVELGDGKVHTAPLNDLRDHDFSIDCWCAPNTDEYPFVKHNSADQREEYETGNRKPN